MSVVILLHAIESTGEVFYPPQYLAEYDPDINDPDDSDISGWVKGTFNPSRAKHYPDAAAAMAEWKRVSKTRPVRPDGQPNRPLSAFTIEIVPAPK